MAAVVLMLSAAHFRIHRTAHPARGESIYTVYTTRPGERATIDLRDGTRVYLNVASTLEVPRAFGDNGRHVHLIGQAAFEVAHATASPFTVDAAGTRTTVLGTAFDVRAYDADVRVAVRTGRVTVAACDATSGDDGCRDDAHRRVVLAENDAASVSPAGRLSVQHGVDVAGDFVFSTGRLVLTGAPLATLIPDLNRWYDADIRLADSSLATRALGGWFPAGTLDDLVQYFTVVLRVHAVRDGRVITLYALPPSSSPLQTQREAH